MITLLQVFSHTSLKSKIALFLTDLKKDLIALIKITTLRTDKATWIGMVLVKDMLSTVPQF